MNDRPRRLLRPLILSIVLAIGLYAGFAIWGDARAVADSAAMLGWLGWGVVLGLSLVNYGLRYLRWQLFLHRQGHHVPGLMSAQYYIAGFAFNTTPAKAGEVIRAWYLKDRHGVGYADSFAALFGDRLMDIAGVLLLTLGVAFTFPDYRWLVGILGGLLLLTLPLTHSQAFHGLVERVASRLRWQKVRQLGLHLVTMLRSASRILSGRTLYLALAISVISWGAEGLGFWWICLALGIEIDPATAFGIYALGMLAGAASFIPGGLGSTEAVMGLLLISLGATPAVAVAATLICRVATLWFAVALGFVAIGRLEWKKSPGRQAIKD